MCGIVAATADENVTSFLLKGLQRLEYRGYDSAGIAVIDENLQRLRSHGKVQNLAELINRSQLSGNLGVAHTRWATHGVPSEHNAHPHMSGDKLAIVHNGIIENYETLKAELIIDGYKFTSETDSEVIGHMINRKIATGRMSILEAVKLSVKKLKGSYALAILSEGPSNQLIVARQGSPLLIGIGEKAHYCASDASALIEKTNQILYLENGDIASLTPHECQVFDSNGEPIKRKVVTTEISFNSIDLGNYKHFMQKEIFEQSEALANTLEMAVAGTSLNPNLFGTDAENIFASIKSITILGCGTSYHAGMTARYWIEDLAGIPCNVEISSEYRYRNSPIKKNDLVIVTSQSGETADTIAALQHALLVTNDNPSLAICNVAESSLIRMSRLKFLTRAGPEIGVASTKAFTTQLGSFFLLAISLAKVKGKLTVEKEKSYLALLRKIPELLIETFKLEAQIKDWAAIFAKKNNCIFLGRGIHFPIALEGALKLKEISYIHAEGYPAGELKHGPLALIDRNTPVIVVAPNDSLLEKLKSNMKEVSARGGQLYVFADANSKINNEPNLNIISMPESSSHISPIVHTIPLQLLSYHTALLKGTNIDKPRNLAKSVTVE